LDASGRFTQQGNTAQTIDVKVNKGAYLDLYSAIGRAFLRDHIQGDTGEYAFAITD
jgi:hypothetical protein